MLRIGIDLGGTKIAGIAFGDDGRSTPELRAPTPRGDYAATIAAICDLAQAVLACAIADGTATGADDSFRIGIGIPGSISPKTGCVQNANSTWLNGRALQADLDTAFGQPVRIENDANCFALSEAHDGAAAGAHSIFGVILGTGCGGGIVVDGRLLAGARGIGGEWGHTPLPDPRTFERPGPPCWCGRSGCLETWISGPGLAADFLQATGIVRDASDIASHADAGDPAALAALARHAERTARGLAAVINIIDPAVIVMGGGLSNLPSLYRDLPALIEPHIFADDRRVEIRPPKWGDASGVRGAARL